VAEFEAEATAYLVAKELQLIEWDAAESRAYIQGWLGGAEVIKDNITRVFAAVNKMLTAGRVEQARRGAGQFGGGRVMSSPHARTGRGRKPPPSGSGGAPARAAMRVGRPEITAIRALQVHQGPLVAQQVLPVRIAVSTVLAITTFGAVIAARAGQPCAAAAVGGRINR
jgi:hypothetical protein